MMDNVTARKTAVELRKTGLLEQEIATQLGKSLGWVKKWLRREREGETLEDRKRSGRPTKLTKKVKKKIVKLLENKQIGSVRKVKRKLEDMDLSLSRPTIAKGAHEMGKKYKKRKKKPLLTDLQKKKRLKFARVEIKKGPQKLCKQYVFYDESVFEGFTTSRGQWVDEIWNAACEAWDNISLQTIRRLISGWGDRLTAVRTSKGGRTKY